jgi:hypothetical protein
MFLHNKKKCSCGGNCDWCSVYTPVSVADNIVTLFTDIRP